MSEWTLPGPSEDGETINSDWHANPQRRYRRREHRSVDDFETLWVFVVNHSGTKTSNQVRYGQRWFLGAQVYWTLIKRQMRVVLADKAAQASANRINTYANLYVQTPLKNAGGKNDSPLFILRRLLWCLLLFSRPFFSLLFCYLFVSISIGALPDFIIF